MTKSFSENLPDFLIIGAQKCGTSALLSNLDRHKAISIPKGELHFFNRPQLQKTDLQWYSQHFQQTRMLQGEKTPDYLDHPLAAERMASLVPDAKLIILLRNPVTRAYSHWNHMMQNIHKTSKRGWEQVSFEEAVDRACAGIKPFDRLLKKGEYAAQIMRYTGHFSPSQLYIGIQERFFLNGREELAKVFDFLGVERADIEPKQRHVRDYESPMCSQMRSRLEIYFAPYNQQLFELLGGAIPEWQN